MTVEETIVPALRDLVRCLIERDFAALEADGRIGRLTVEELAKAIDDYGRSLAAIPDHGWDLADSYEIEGRPNSWAIDLPLWTQEEGRSDLTLSISAERRDDGSVVLEVDDLHVL